MIAFFEDGGQSDLFTPLVQPEHSKDSTIQERFAAFHKANPWVYRALVREARSAKERGLRRVGIGFLTELLRWKYAEQSRDANSAFKINNDYRSRYARLILDTETDLHGFISLRELKTA